METAVYVWGLYHKEELKRASIFRSIKGPFVYSSSQALCLGLVMVLWVDRWLHYDLPSLQSTTDICCCWIDGISHFKRGVLISSNPSVEWCNNRSCKHKVTPTSEKISTISPLYEIIAKRNKCCNHLIMNNRHWRERKVSRGDDFRSLITVLYQIAKHSGTSLCLLHPTPYASQWWPPNTTRTYALVKLIQKQKHKSEARFYNYIASLLAIRLNIQHVHSL